MAEYNFKKEKDMWLASRTPQNCWARWITWHFMKQTGMNYAMVGDYTGHHHGTVISGIRKLHDDLRLKSHPMLPEIYKRISDKI